jgi:hypothetical protein
MFRSIAVYIDALMSSVDQNNEIIEHITLKRGPFITKHVVHIPPSHIDLHCYYEITR